MTATSDIGTLDAILAEQARAWDERPLLRRLYRGWYDTISSRLARIPGPVVELGSGIGKLKDIVPGAVLTDVEPTRWTSNVVDAEALPYDDASIANLVLFDVFHHLASPSRFLDEAQRALAPSGRVIVFDPYCSPLSTRAYRRFHHERTDLAGSAFDEDADVATAPFASNQARATLAFFREFSEFETRWPDLRAVERRRLAMLAYPLSGGFSGRRIIPLPLVRPVELLESALAPLAPLLAFRCLVVLERR